MLPVERVKAPAVAGRDNVPMNAPGRLYSVMDQAVVDLYGLRCAVACLVHARDNIDHLTTAHVVRFDAAIRLMSRARKSTTAAIAASTERLLSPSEDRHGERTAAAIDRLAELVNVNTATAPALAASLPTGAVQGKLFD